MKGVLNPKNITILILDGVKSQTFLKEALNSTKIRKRHLRKNCVQILINIQIWPKSKTNIMTMSFRIEFPSQLTFSPVFQTV